MEKKPWTSQKCPPFFQVSVVFVGVCVYERMYAAKKKPGQFQQLCSRSYNKLKQKKKGKLNHTDVTILCLPARRGSNGRERTAQEATQYDYDIYCTFCLFVCVFTFLISNSCSHRNWESWQFEIQIKLDVTTLIQEQKKGTGSISRGLVVSYLYTD